MVGACACVIESCAGKHLVAAANRLHATWRFADARFQIRATLPGKACKLPREAVFQTSPSQCKPVAIVPRTDSIETLGSHLQRGVPAEADLHPSPQEFLAQHASQLCSKLAQE